MKSTALVEDIIMGMAADSGCHFEKLTAKHIKLLDNEKPDDVVRTTIRVSANETQAMKGFVALLKERADRMFLFEAEGTKVYIFEAFQRNIKVVQRSGVLSLIIFL